MPHPAPTHALQTSSLDEQLQDELAALDAAGLRRTLRPVARDARGTLRTADGATLVDFASNDYLGLAADSRPAAAAAALLGREGLGAGAARLIAGDHALHHALEAALAALKGTERALLFPSGCVRERRRAARARRSAGRDLLRCAEPRLADRRLPAVARDRARLPACRRRRARRDAARRRRTVPPPLARRGGRVLDGRRSLPARRARAARPQARRAHATSTTRTPPA